VPEVVDYLKDAVRLDTGLYNGSPWCDWGTNDASCGAAGIDTEYSGQTIPIQWDGRTFRVNGTITGGSWREDIDIEATISEDGRFIESGHFKKVRTQGEFIKTFEYDIVNLPYLTPDPPYANAYAYVFEADGAAAIEQAVRNFNWVTTRNDEVEGTFKEFQYDANPVFKLTFYTK
jgi:hypothetical protein